MPKQKNWWSGLDSNQRPGDEKSITLELRLKISQPEQGMLRENSFSRNHFLEHEIPALPLSYRPTFSDVPFETGGTGRI
jgi:hypothetical protein